MREIILIIGSEGFIGRSFIEYYFRENEDRENLFMISRRNITRKNYYMCDCINFENLNKIIKKLKPDIIYNFAGSFSNNFEEDYQNNVGVTKNILDTIIKNDLDCKVLINGSAAEYGFIKDIDFPINENYPLNPVSFYGLTKVFQTFLARSYYLKNDIKIYITRPFNIIGYGISKNLFIGNLINQIKFNLKNKSKITLGNLSSERDYLDVEDLILAYNIIMSKGNPGEVYNVGLGKAIKIKTLLDSFLKIFKIDRSFVEISEGLKKNFDMPKIFADISKLKKLQWEPKISLEESIQRIKAELVIN